MPPTPPLDEGSPPVPLAPPQPRVIDAGAFAFLLVLLVLGILVMLTMVRH